jgi:hypothetical protein
MIGIIKPSTVLLIFCNVLIFMFMQVLLFWFVISKAVENIIIDKSAIIKEIINNSTLIQQKFNNYIHSDEYLTVYNQSLIDKQSRTDFNMNLTWKWMLIPFLIIVTILVIGVIYTAYVHRYTQYNTLKLDKTDLIVLAMVFLSFLTEIIFIFVLVMRYVYVSDMDMVIFFMNSNFVLFEITPPPPPPYTIPYTFPLD